MISSHLHTDSVVLFYFLQALYFSLEMRSIRLSISQSAPFFQICHYWDCESLLCDRALFTQGHPITCSCLSWVQRFSHAPILNSDWVRKEMTRAFSTEKNLQFSWSLHSSSSCRTAVCSLSSSISFALPAPPKPKPHPPPPLFYYCRVWTYPYKSTTRFSSRALAAA